MSTRNMVAVPILKIAVTLQGTSLRRYNYTMVFRDILRSGYKQSDKLYIINMVR